MTTDVFQKHFWLECKKDFKDFSIAAISPPKVTAP